jgi:hypothetical protein
MKHLLITAALLALMGCRAEDEVKQGVQGEFCNDSDADCREGYICDRGYCRLQAVEGTDCRAMCARIATCGIEDEACVADCQATIAGDCGSELPCPWSDDAVQAFGSCMVNDLTCDVLETGEGPQLCYDQLAIPTERRRVCDQIEGFLNDSCGIENTDLLKGRCYQLARTATDSSFERTATCHEAALDGQCLDTVECVNVVFVLTPAITLESSNNDEP